MNRKMQHQVQPPASIPLRKEQVRREIQNFLKAVDSYPARAEKEPSLSFRRYLSSFFAVDRDGRRDRRSRRH
jgi:hypothetical protein